MTQDVFLIDLAHTYSLISRHTISFVRSLTSMGINEILTYTEAKNAYKASHIEQVNSCVQDEVLLNSCCDIIKQEVTSLNLTVIIDLEPTTLSP